MATLRKSPFWPWALVFVAIECPLLHCGSRDDQWHNLDRITRHRVYTVVYSDRRCVAARLLGTANDLLRIEAQSEPAVVRSVRRDEILRAGETARATDMLFSNRSSWADVQAVRPHGSEHLRVMTSDGREHRVAKPTVSDSAIAGDGKNIRKSDVLRVFYIRLKPITETEAYTGREGVVLPRLWFNGAFLGKVAVLLFDAQMPEDNSPVECLKRTSP